jgi:hypothetical protein
MNEHYYSPIAAMSDQPDQPYTAEQVRGFVLPKMFLLQSLARHMSERLRHAHEIVSNAEAETTSDRVHVWMAAVATITALIENMLKLYTTIASEVDTRTEEGRKSLQRLFIQERDPEEETTLHNRVWLFQQLEFVGDEAFNAAGIEPSEARAHIANMIERSIAYLKNSELRMRTFYRKYLPIVNAHKHGRSLFALVPIKTATGFTLQASDSALTALLSKHPGRDRPTRLVTFTADDELQRELADTLTLLDVQVPRFIAFAESLADSAVLYLNYLEGATPDRKPMLQFSFFAHPYSEREQKIIAALRGARLGPPGGASTV